MRMNREGDLKAQISGNVLRQGAKREIAIYLRDGVTWVADFRGGSGELFTAGEWFALNRGAGALRRAERDSIEPLPAYVVERIERLHSAERSEDAPVLTEELAAFAARLRDRLRDFSARYFAARRVSA